VIQPLLPSYTASHYTIATTSIGWQIDISGISNTFLSSAVRCRRSLYIALNEYGLTSTSHGSIMPVYPNRMLYSNPRFGSSSLQYTTMLLLLNAGCTISSMIRSASSVETTRHCCTGIQLPRKPPLLPSPLLPSVGIPSAEVSHVKSSSSPSAI
jgi:hypothetical protein